MNFAERKASLEQVDSKNNKKKIKITKQNILVDIYHKQKK